MHDMIKTISLIQFEIEMIQSELKLISILVRKEQD